MRLSAELESWDPGRNCPRGVLRTEAVHGWAESEGAGLVAVRQLVTRIAVLGPRAAGAAVREQ